MANGKNECECHASVIEKQYSLGLFHFTLYDCLCNIAHVNFHEQINIDIYLLKKYLFFSVFFSCIQCTAIKIALN